MMYFCLAACDCSKLTVKSIKLQPSFAGQYTRLDDPFNGRPVYKHTTLNRFLYLVDAQSKFWLFGTEQGKNRGLILAHSDAEEPSQVKTSWRAYDSSDMTWKDDDTVSLQCDCQGMDSVTFYPVLVQWNFHITSWGKLLHLSVVPLSMYSRASL